MTSPAVTAGSPPSVPVAPLPSEEARLSCDVCPHPTASHDAIGARFCSATLHGALTRGCICSAT